MKKEVKAHLLKLADIEYQKFSSRLLPHQKNVLGVRLPELRKLAKQIAKDDWQSYLEKADDQYFEEVMIQGMVIGYAKADIEVILTYVKWFVPKIDNWSVCDSFCSSLKVTKKYRRRVWTFLQPYLVSSQEYELRFGVVMLLMYYIDSEHMEKVLAILDSINHKGYYVKMAVTWAISICYIKFSEPTMNYLKHNNLDHFTYNKALQKITESTRVDKESKHLIRSMRRR